MNHRIRPLCTNKKCKAFRNTVFNKKKRFGIYLSFNTLNININVSISQEARATLFKKVKFKEYKWH